MKSRFLIIIPIVVGFAISLPFIISSTSGGTYYSQDIDPRFSEVTRNGFEISSNMDIYAIYVADNTQSIVITTSKNTNGFIHMDDPLPVLQKLFPDKDIVSFVVLVNDIEIPYILEYGKLAMDVNDAGAVLIIGMSKIWKLDYW